MVIAEEIFFYPVGMSTLFSLVISFLHMEMVDKLLSIIFLLYGSIF